MFHAVLMGLLRPCYIALKNNVSTIEMEMTTHSWKPGTEEFVPHHILADYIQGAATANGINDFIRFNTRVTNVVKEGSQWRVETAKHLDSRSHAQVQQYDGLVIATGHYHACNIPDIPGLSEWKRRFTTRVWHSKRYRKPDQFKGQNVLLVGAGVSSIDIARDLGSVAASIYQSSRGGMYDLPSHLLPDNAARVGGVKSFDVLDSSELVDGGSIPGTITLVSGEKLCNIHQVILCTGYHVSFPFMKQYHADALRPEEANEEVLVTDGQVTHNLHKDIWYIPDPTLAFMGVPYHTATFTLFEFQAMGLAAVFSGEVLLPLMEEMRKEYRERVKRKGAGRTLHSLKDYGLEAGYVNELVDMVNEGLLVPSKKRMTGHSTTWLEAYERRRKRLELLLSNVRDPSLDHRTLEQVVGC